MTDPIEIHQYENGLVLVTQCMDWVESAAFSLLVPAGCSRDPRSQLGLANLTCEMAQRGCGARDSRQFVNDLENLGVDHNASVSLAHTSFGGAMPAECVEAALAIHADLVLRPHLPADQLEDARLSCIQELRALEDDLAQRAMHELRRQRYGDPWGRHSAGTLDAIQRAKLEDVAQFHAATYRPNGAIVSVAGKIDAARLRDTVGELFAAWSPAPVPEQTPSAGNGTCTHLPHDSNQTHITLGFPSVPYGHRDYYQARAAVGVLSDGMSSRLFTEVRERRGLCYAVYAVCHTLRDRGSVFCYAGTTTERAQETLDVIVHELRQLAQGIRADELQRLKARLKSALIMQQESSAARSGSIAADWYYLGRVQTLAEVGRIVDELSCESINGYLAAHPPGALTVVTLGQQPLELPR
ncbi:MAG: insulinase family protein [Pirellulaceae bacterium]|nr:insulinase family protein [Pirellulaceae bacterium]